MQPLRVDAGFAGATPHGCLKGCWTFVRWSRCGSRSRGPPGEADKAVGDVNRLSWRLLERPAAELAHTPRTWPPARLRCIPRPAAGCPTSSAPAHMCAWRSCAQSRWTRLTSALTSGPSPPRCQRAVAARSWGRRSFCEAAAGWRLGIQAASMRCRGLPSLSTAVEAVLSRQRLALLRCYLHQG